MFVNKNRFSILFLLNSKLSIKYFSEKFFSTRWYFIFNKKVNLFSTKPFQTVLTLWKTLHTDGFNHFMPLISFYTSMIFRFSEGVVKDHWLAWNGLIITFMYFRSRKKCSRLPGISVKEHVTAKFQKTEFAK